MERITRGFLFFCALVFISFSFISCSTVETETRKILENKYKMTKEEAKVGAAHALRLHRAQKTSEGKLLIEEDKNGNKHYPIDFSSISIDDKIEKLEEAIKIINLVEDERKLDAQDKRFLDYFPQIGERLARQRGIFEWQIKRYRRVQKYSEFRRKLGFTGKEKEDKKFKDSAYITCPLVELEKDTVFKPDYVILAEKEGRIKFLERLVVDWTYMKEEDNPDYPEKDPTQNKIWKEKRQRLLFETVDVNMPSDNKADYIRVFRLDEKNIPEKHPAVSVFHTINSKRLMLAILDSSKSTDTSFGVPDQIMTISAIDKGSEIIENYKGLIDIILNPESPDNKKFKLREDKMKVYLVQPGEINVSREQVNEDGWKIPLTYKIAGKMGEVENFKVYIKFETPKESEKTSAKKIGYIVFKYHSSYSSYLDVEGRVLEFYRPKKEMRDMKIVKINIRGKEVTIFLKDKPAIQVLAKGLVSKNPYRIDYDFGKERISIIDKNGKGVYTVKRSQAKPTSINFKYDVKPEQTASYSDYH